MVIFSWCFVSEVIVACFTASGLVLWKPEEDELEPLSHAQMNALIRKQTGQVLIV